MRAGQLDQIVTFQRRTATADGAGGRTYAWTDFARAWANVRARGGRESLAENRVSAEALYTFTIRNRTDVDETFRIIWRDEPYNIRAVMRGGNRPLYLQIDAERGVADVS